MLPKYFMQGRREGRMHGKYAAESGTDADRRIAEADTAAVDAARTKMRSVARYINVRLAVGALD